MTGLWQAIANQIGQSTGQPCQIQGQRSVGGGSINTAYVIQTSERSFFVKTNRATDLEMFVAEAEGLQELDRAQAVRVPRPICWGSFEATAYLVLEDLQLGGNRSGAAAALGRQLARMHRHTQPQGRFGWHRHNTIGSTPQINTWSEDWVSFYRDQRLDYQIRLARRQGYTGAWNQDAERLMEQVAGFFVSYTPDPAVLHGDLWAGNYGVDATGQPVIFDPAVYFGDRETDLAMTELFGGFPGEFYQAYQQEFPLDPGYPLRKPLYQLYHLLNHLNLFGGVYLRSVKAAIQKSLQGLEQL